jgi:hypothetical protein
VKPAAFSNRRWIRIKLLGREEKIKSNIKNAAAYPIMVLLVEMVSVVVMLTDIAENISTIGAEQPTLPMPTQIPMCSATFCALRLAAGDPIIAGGYLSKMERQSPGNYPGIRLAENRWLEMSCGLGGRQLPDAACCVKAVPLLRTFSRTIIGK